MPLLYIKIFYSISIYVDDTVVNCVKSSQENVLDLTANAYDVQKVASGIGRDLRCK